MRRKTCTGVAQVIENWEGKMVLVSCQCLVIYHEVKYELTIQVRNSILCCLSKENINKTHIMQRLGHRCYHLF